MTNNIDRSGFRFDIQGLRAVAVTLVVLDHALDFPAGGFVGVDVFFVISGYLITLHMLREIESTGSLSILNFYARRIRRILPVAVFVALATVLFSFLLWFPPRALQSLIDAVSALTFVANFHFMALGTDYLQQDAAVSPFQHYWSLSIEEQFYAVWPLALLAMSLFVRSKRSIATIVIICFVASMIWAGYRSIATPATAYFDTGARAWELLAGALLAMAGSSKNQFSVSQSIRQVISFFGVVLILVPTFLITSSWITPFPAVVPAVAGTMMVIWSNATTSKRTLLGNPVSQWLGNVSYSLYLWHFPVLVFATAEFGHSWIVGLSVIPLMILLSWLSYIFVEQGVLKSSFLAPKQTTTKKKWKLSSEFTVGFLVLGAIAFFSFAQLTGDNRVLTARPWLKLFDNTNVSNIDVATSEEQKIGAVRDALEASQWPENIYSQLSSLSENDFSDAMFECRQNPQVAGPPRVCNFQHGDTRVAIIGDSIAASWVPAIEAIGRERAWDVTVVSYSNCSLFDVDVTNRRDDPGFKKACKVRRAEMFDFLRELDPKIVFLSASETALTYSGLELDAAAIEWKAGAERTFQNLETIEQVVVLENPPAGANPTECATRYSTPASCVGQISERHHLKSSAESSAAEDFDNVSYVSTRPWFCFEENCPIFSSGLLMRGDTSHLTSASATSLSNLIAQHVWLVK